MIDRFAQFPRALASQARLARLANVPALLAHPDWISPRPTVVWLHGRTVSKELDPGRYLRWIRAGLAACAIDLPGHGERREEGMDAPERTLDVLERAVPEIDAVVEALHAPSWGGVFDPGRLAIGGMSAGGMATLRRLCDPHPFRCAAVEATCGLLADLYAPGRWLVEHEPARVAGLDPGAHLASWRPIPILVLHATGDRLVPFALQVRFAERLRALYRSRGASDAMIEVRSWSETGAPDEHAGFGRFSNDAKNAQVEFLARHLRATDGAPA